MYLMLCDRPIAFFELSSAACKIYYPELLPQALKKIQLDASPTEIIIEILDFLAKRVFTLSRANAKQLYSLVGNDQSQTLKNLIRIALLCHAVSVNDSYWVKTDEPPYTWREINIRHNRLNRIFTQVALQGTYSFLEGSFITPELTTDGTTAKGWKRENGDLWLYKKGERAKIEVMVSNILDHFNVEHVRYFDAVDSDGEYCCKCKCLSDDKIHIVSAADVSVEQEPDYKMWIVDYLIANTDRHNRNYGYFVDTRTTKILGPHPLFDHDHAFGRVAMMTEHLPYKAGQLYTMKEAAHEARKHVDLYYTRDFGREEFQTELQYRSFMSKLIELRIQKRG